MALNSTAVIVSTATPTAIVSLDDLDGGSLYDPVPILLRNRTGNNVYLGSSSVTTANGYILGSSGELSFSLFGGDVMFGLTSGTTSEVRVLKGRQ